MSPLIKKNRERIDRVIDRLFVTVVVNV